MSGRRDRPALAITKACAGRKLTDTSDNAEGDDVRARTLSVV